MSTEKPKKKKGPKKAPLLAAGVAAASTLAGFLSMHSSEHLKNTATTKQGVESILNPEQNPQDSARETTTPDLKKFFQNLPPVPEPLPLPPLVDLGKITEDMREATMRFSPTIPEAREILDRIRKGDGKALGLFLEMFGRLCHTPIPELPPGINSWSRNDQRAYLQVLEKQEKKKEEDIKRETMRTIGINQDELSVFEEVSEAEKLLRQHHNEPTSETYMKLFTKMITISQLTDPLSSSTASLLGIRKEKLQDIAREVASYMEDYTSVNTIQFRTAYGI